MSRYTALQNPVELFRVDVQRRFLDRSRNELGRLRMLLAGGHGWHRRSRGTVVHDWLRIWYCWATNLAHSASCLHLCMPDLIVHLLRRSTSSFLLHGHLPTHPGRRLRQPPIRQRIWVSLARSSGRRGHCRRLWGDALHAVVHPRLWYPIRCGICHLLMYRVALALAGL